MNEQQAKNTNEQPKEVGFTLNDWANTKAAVFDRREIFDNEILPALTVVNDLCASRGISFFAVAGVANGGGKRETCQVFNCGSNNGTLENLTPDTLLPSILVDQDNPIQMMMTIKDVFDAQSEKISNGNLESGDETSQQEQSAEPAADDQS